MSMIQKLDEKVRQVVDESRLDLSAATEVYSRASDLYLEIPRIAKTVAKEMGAKEINEVIFFVTLHRLSELQIVKQDEYLSKAIALEKSRLKKLADLKMIAGFVKEPEYQEKSLHWDRVCLDSTYHALDACFTIDRIRKYRALESRGKLDDILALQRKKPNEWEEECHIGQVDVERFLLPLFDEYSGGFRQCPEFEPDVYSTDDACRIIFDLTSKTRLPEKLTSQFELTYSFLLGCQDRETGAFSDRPFLPPTVATTFAALCSLSRLIDWLTSHGLTPRANFKTPLNKTIEYLYRKCAKESDNVIGFSNTPYDDPMVCSTYYAIRTARRILELQSRKLNEVLDQDFGKRILEFIRRCWREQDGGYSCKLGGKRATLVHTRYAILTILELLSNDILKAEYVVNDFHPDSVLRFISSCYSEGGFGTLPGITPTAYSTRAAVKIIECLELLRVRKGIETDANYEERMDKFDGEKIEEFIGSCYDRHKLGYAGLPIG